MFLDVLSCFGFFSWLLKNAVIYEIPRQEKAHVFSFFIKLKQNPKLFVLLPKNDNFKHAENERRKF